ALPPLFPLCRSLQAVESGLPELVEEALQLLDLLRTRAVEASRSVASFRHEPRLLQDGQVLRDRRTRHLERLGDLSRRPFLVPDEPEDSLPSRFRDGLQGSFHARDSKTSLT